MKFLIDAQLPARLAEFLTGAGHDTVHTIELPNGNRSTDQQIAELADADSRVVVAKDRDFRDSHLLAWFPRQLLIVATGDITNDALLALFVLHLDASRASSSLRRLVFTRERPQVRNPPLPLGYRGLG